MSDDDKGWFEGSANASETTYGACSRRDVMGAAVAFGVLPGLTSCGFLPMTWTYRYRLTAELECSGQVYRAASVIEVKREKGINGIGAKVRGEAAFVSGPGAKAPLFFLMYTRAWGDDWPYVVPHYALRDELGSVDMVDPKILDRIVDSAGVKGNLAPDIYPLITTFDDIHDSRTIREIFPNEVASRYNPDCHLRSIALEITNDPLEPRVQSVLPWLHSGPEQPLEPAPQRGPLSPILPLNEMLSSKAFIRT